MSHRMQLFCILIFALLLGGCGEDTQSRDDVPPQTPQMIARSDDAIYPQAGVRAEPTTNDRNYWTRIEWYRNPESDVASYRVLRWPEHSSALHGQVVADLTLGIELTDQFELFWVDRGNDQFGGSANLLAPNDQGLTRGYWWQVQAVDTAGNRSGWSDSVYFRMIPNPYDLAVVGSGDDVRLTWSYPIGGAGIYLSFYKFRVYSQWYGRDSLVWDHRAPLYAQNNSVQLGIGGAFTSMTHDCTYVWQLNAISYVASDTNDVALAGSAMFTPFKYSQ